MNAADLDLGYDSLSNGNDDAAVDEQSPVQEDVTNIQTGQIDNDINGQASDSLDESDRSEVSGSEGINNIHDVYPEGTVLEIDGNNYTVDSQGNIVDDNGNVVLDANEVQDQVDRSVEEDDSDYLSIDDIQDALNIDILDEDGQPIEYDNTTEGIVDYIQDVMEESRMAHYNEAMNTFFSRYPVVKDILDYYVANGNSMDGYGQYPDRSGIRVDPNNQMQQEAIIRTAWNEQNRKGDIDGYIEYVKANGTLAEVAASELRGLQEADAEYKQNLEQQRLEIENQNQQRLADYWNNVYDTISNRNIAGYQIPEDILVMRNGERYSLTPDDFFDYIYQTDEYGKSRYENDLANQDPEEKLQDELLRAYIKFVGGSFSNLVGMAINKENVTSLKNRASERRSSVRVFKPKTTPAKGINIDLGYE